MIRLRVCVIVREIVLAWCYQAVEDHLLKIGAAGFSQSHRRTADTRLPMGTPVTTVNLLSGPGYVGIAASRAAQLDTGYVGISPHPQT